MGMQWTIDGVVKCLKEDKIGIFPCDTIWGIIGRANSDVVRKIRSAKGRTEHKGFIILVPNAATIPEWIVDFNDDAEELIKEYWPGPLSLIFYKAPHIDGCLTGNQATIAIRYPKFGPLNTLLDTLGEPIISSSVNFSSHHYLNNLQRTPPRLLELMDFVYDSDLPPLGKESTIINTTTRPMSIARQGSLVVNL